MSTSTVDVPGLVAGTWTIDPVHSEVGFSVRHLMVSKVRGSFKIFEGTITVAENPLDSKVEATHRRRPRRHPRREPRHPSPLIGLLRDRAAPEDHLRLDQGAAAGGEYVVTGDLTIHGVTHSVDLGAGVQRRVSRTPGAVSGPGSPPPPRSAGAISGSSSTCRSTAAGSSSATRSRSASRSRPSCRRTRRRRNSPSERPVASRQVRSYGPHIVRLNLSTGWTPPHISLQSKSSARWHPVYLPQTLE